MAITTTDTALLRLLQLSSPALPVGGYAFSHGLEYAIDAGWLTGAQDVRDWLHTQLQVSQAGVDLPILYRMIENLARHDMAALALSNDTLLACRETRELRLADTAMGEALLRLYPALGLSHHLPQVNEPTFLLLFVQAGYRWGIAPDDLAQAWLWSWLENQVAAATKLVPLGQSQAQQLLSELLATLPPLITRAGARTDAEPGACLPALAIASARHENQYSRLFRS